MSGYTLNELWHLYWDSEGVPPGNFNGRAYQWLFAEVNATSPVTLNELWYMYWSGAGGGGDELVLDTFSEPNDPVTFLNTRPPDIGTTPVAYGTESWRTINEFGVNGAGGGSTWSTVTQYLGYESGQSDVRVTCAIRPKLNTASSQYGLFVRGDGTENNLYVFFMNNSTLFIYKRIAGAYTSLQSVPFAFVPDQVYEVEFVASGSTLQVYVDTVLQLSVINSEITGTIHGMAANFVDQGRQAWPGPFKVEQGIAQIQFPEQTMTAGSVGNIHGFRKSLFGSVTPDQTANGDDFVRLTVNNNNGKVVLRVDGSYPQDTFTNMEIVGVGGLNTVDATYSNPAGDSQWTWSGTGFSLTDGVVYAINYS